MNIILWIVQVLVTLLFLAAGSLKISQPKDKLEQRMSWVKHAPAQAVKVIGVLEVLGALGVILPALTGILPWLTPLAAMGLVLTMIGAIVTHIQLAEYSKITGPIVLLVLAAVIAYGRFVIAPF
jgi:uncharacterized membrane protein YphA (DoxX/SURF4 family)